MRCNEFDTYVDEMLSGILYPEASRHLRECESCSADYAQRSAVQANLRRLAASATAGPSAATDRAVLEAYRRRQQRLSVPAAAAPPVLHFPRHASVSARAWWSGLAAAALLVASISSPSSILAARRTSEAAMTSTPAKTASRCLRAGPPRKLRPVELLSNNFADY